MYILSCEREDKGGGIYRCTADGRGSLQVLEHFPCDRPMYGIRAGGRLHILLRAPFRNSENSGYFSCKEDFTDATACKDTLGKVACHLCAAGNDIYIVNYLSGNIVKNCERAVAHCGYGPNVSRQEAPHTHCVVPSPDGAYILCTDLGTDSLYVYDRELGLVCRAKVPDGFGIRHILFSADGTRIYAVNELVPSVSMFAWEKDGARYIDTVRLTEREGATGAAIRLSEDEKYLFVSVRGENRIYVCDAQSGKVLHSADCGGDGPRDFNFFEDGHLVCCNEKNDLVTVFPFEDGHMRGKSGAFSLPAPLCVF